MIFITTGTQLPFERLLNNVDEWASNNTDTKIVAQAGVTDFKSQFIKVYDFLSPEQYINYIKESKLIIGHAGSGTLLTAIKYNKPAILMPRRYDLCEHRSEHQLGMATFFNSREGIYISKTKESLFKLLTDYENLRAPSEQETPSREKLMSYLRKQIFTD
jgi:UDP-N-acetylglucosamine transferase subunit ALG13